jgi:hypothetical protein
LSFENPQFSQYWLVGSPRPIIHVMLLKKFFQHN